MPYGLSYQNLINQYLKYYTTSYPLKKATCCCLFWRDDKNDPGNKEWKILRSIVEENINLGLCCGHVNAWVLSIMLQYQQQALPQTDAAQTDPLIPFEYEPLTIKLVERGGTGDFKSFYDFTRPENIMIRKYVKAIIQGQEHLRIDGTQLPQAHYVQVLESLDPHLKGTINLNYSIALLFKLADIKEVILNKLTIGDCAYVATSNHIMAIHWKSPRQVLCFDANDTEIIDAIGVEPAAKYILDRILNNANHTLQADGLDTSALVDSRYFVCRISIIKHNIMSHSLHQGVADPATENKSQTPQTPLQDYYRMPRREMAPLAVLHNYLYKGYGNAISHDNLMSILQLLIYQHENTMLKYALTAVKKFADMSSLFNSQDTTDETAELEVKTDENSLVQQFLVDVNLAVKFGRTPIMFAVECDNAQAVELLLRRPDLQVEECDIRQLPALFIALAKDNINIDVVKALLHYPNWKLDQPYPAHSLYDPFLFIGSGNSPLASMHCDLNLTINQYISAKIANKTSEATLAILREVKRLLGEYQHKQRSSNQEITTTYEQHFFTIDDVTIINSTSTDSFMGDLTPRTLHSMTPVDERSISLVEDKGSIHDLCCS